MRGPTTSPSANEGIHALDRQVHQRKRAASPPEKNDARDTRRSHTIFRDLRRFGPRRPPDRRARATQNKGRAGLMVANDHVGHPISSRSRPYTPRTAHASQEAARSHTPNAVFRAGTCSQGTNLLDAQLMFRRGQEASPRTSCRHMQRVCGVCVFRKGE